MFDKKGLIVIVDEDDEIDEDELMMTALDAGAEDFTAEETTFEIVTAPDDFTSVCDALESAGYKFESAEISMIPQNTVSINAETETKLNKLLDLLEDNDDVQNVYHNAELPE